MEKRQQFEQQLIEKAMKDPDFRKRLIENPKAVIKEETGIDLPASINLKILEEDPQTVYLVLPHLNARDDEAEITNNELEKIVGGEVFTGFAFCHTSHCPPWSEDDPGCN